MSYVRTTPKRCTPEEKISPSRGVFDESRLATINMSASYRSIEERKRNIIASSKNKN
jgi:hypothetical protein